MLAARVLTRSSILTKTFSPRVFPSFVIPNATFKNAPPPADFQFFEKQLRTLSAENKGTELLREFEKMKLFYQPTINEYNLLIAYHLGKKETHKTKAILEELSQRNVFPNQVTYDLLLDYYTRNEKVDDILNILAQAGSDEALVSSMGKYI